MPAEHLGIASRARCGIDPGTRWCLPQVRVRSNLIYTGWPGHLSALEQWIYTYKTSCPPHNFHPTIAFPTTSLAHPLRNQPINLPLPLATLSPRATPAPLNTTLKHLAFIRSSLLYCIFLTHTSPYIFIEGACLSFPPPDFPPVPPCALIPCTTPKP
jgi:hypothetical protein